jgi:AcrR family transcriptional regulator
MTNQTLLRQVAEQGAVTSDRIQLERFDWLSSALSIFVSEGIDAVRITRLAETLKVTRGSFYWHFSNRDDLIDTLVQYWKNKNTPAILDSIENPESLDDGILSFFEACVDENLFDSRLDLALREWARRSDDIHAEVEKADQHRIEGIQQLYESFGFPMPESLIRARVIYFAQIGFYALDVKEPMSTRISYTEAYYTAFTGRILDPQKSKTFCDRMIRKFGED